MSKKMAKFQKVSFEQFKKDMIDTFNDTYSDEQIRQIYNYIKLPVRATTGSAGYDFVSPIDFTLNAGESIQFPTGIRCKMCENWVLMIFPRSGLGFKYRAQLDNTVGIIDSDYFYSDNEGNIGMKITNDSRENKTLVVHSGDRIAQGVFVPFGITQDDNVNESRTGGFGSTGK